MVFLIAYGIDKTSVTRGIIETLLYGPVKIKEIKEKSLLMHLTVCVPRLYRVRMSDHFF